jgi:tetratricopeptide (TPR) repeat protein
MAEKNIAEVPREVRALYDRGFQAYQRQNFDYAISILNQVLVREPGLFECRQTLRAAQFKKHGTRTSFFRRMLGGASSSPMLAKAQMSLRKAPLEALQTVEQILNADPNNSGAHKMLAEAALAAEFPQTACLSLEILLKNSPNDFELRMLYAQALAGAGQQNKAESIYTELMQAYPHKPEIAQALKNISARHTLDTGGYEALADGTGSYRDILKDKQEAISLEQEKREVKTEDVVQRLIHEYEARLTQEGRNIKLLRSLAELYGQKKDFARALKYCARIKALEGGDEPTLERTVADLTVRKFEHALEQLDPQAPDYAQRRAQIQAERDLFEIDECKSRSERYPTDLQIRYDLGELYFKAGKISEAIQEFQKAQANPNRRVQSLGYLGQCFARRGMNDMAARTLQNAIKEKQGFDDEKKELIYQLGCVLETMGKRAEAIEQLKVIYEVDIGYKDVAAKVDAFYSGK